MSTYFGVQKTTVIITGGCILKRCGGSCALSEACVAFSNSDSRCGQMIGKRPASPGIHYMKKNKKNVKGILVGIY